MATTTRVRRTRADWQAVIFRAERSALSTAAFCAAEGISTASFYLWRKRLRASNPPQGDVGEEAPGRWGQTLGSRIVAKQQPDLTWERGSTHTNRVCRRLVPPHLPWRQAGGIHEDDEDRRGLLGVLGKVAERYNWICHCYCLMRNHYHLVAETVEGNLS